MQISRPVEGLSKIYFASNYGISMQITITLSADCILSADETTCVMDAVFYMFNKFYKYKNQVTALGWVHEKNKSNQFSSNF